MHWAPIKKLAIFSLLFLSCRAPTEHRKQTDLQADFIVLEDEVPPGSSTEEKGEESPVQNSLGQENDAAVVGSIGIKVVWAEEKPPLASPRLDNAGMPCTNSIENRAHVVFFGENLQKIEILGVEKYRYYNAAEKKICHYSRNVCKDDIKIEKVNDKENTFSLSGLYFPCKNTDWILQFTVKINDRNKKYYLRTDSFDTVSLP